MIMEAEEPHNLQLQTGDPGKWAVLFDLCQKAREPEEQMV